MIEASERYGAKLATTSLFKRAASVVGAYRGTSLATAHLIAVPAIRHGWYWGAFSTLGVIHGLLALGTFRPHSRLFGPVVSSVPGHTGVWLTIDDGPSSDTERILELLRQHEAKATFFLVAERARRFPELVRAIRNDGHDIGNHTTTHPAAWFWALPPNRMVREIENAQAILGAIAGEAPRWFRAVVGHANPFVTPVLKEMGLTRVSWSARGFDAVDGNVERVISRLRSGIRPGAIIVLHEGAPHGASVRIIERTMREIETRGLKAALPPN